MIPADTAAPEQGKFPTTNWSLVARIRSADEAVAARALEDLCAQYHYPLYCYLRRCGCTHHDAQDVLHDFLLRVFLHRSLEQLEESRRRLCGWLATALGNHFLNWRRSESRREQTLDAAEGGFERGGSTSRRSRLATAASVSATPTHPIASSSVNGSSNFCAT